MPDEELKNRIMRYVYNALYYLLQFYDSVYYNRYHIQQTALRVSATNDEEDLYDF